MGNESAVMGNLARLRLQSGVARREPSADRERAKPWIAYLALIGSIIPAAEVQIYLAGAKLTVGRLIILLLLVPSFVALLQKGRRLQLADVLVFAMAGWIVGAALDVDGSKSLSSAGAEALEFLGGYFVARAFFFGRGALLGFLEVLKIFALIVIILAIGDTMTGRLITHDTFGAIFHVTPIEDQFRRGTVRATAAFDHAILLGTFCSVVAAMLIYSEANLVKKVGYSSLCFLGAFLSLSSSSLMAFVIAMATCAYDTILSRYSWRWPLCWSALGLLSLGILVTTNNPLGWILSHLTLEPASGYFRLMEWEAAIYQISLAPWAGHAFAEFGSAELFSVDSVWLALTLRFGIPVVVLLILANVAAMLPTKAWARLASDPVMTRMRTAFSLILIIFMFVGLTVHYWNYMWIFWGICLGIRASLREHAIVTRSRGAPSHWAEQLHIGNKEHAQLTGFGVRPRKLGPAGIGWRA